MDFEGSVPSAGFAPAVNAPSSSRASWTCTSERLIKSLIGRLDSGPIIRRLIGRFAIRLAGLRPEAKFVATAGTLRLRRKIRVRLKRTSQYSTPRNTRIHIHQDHRSQGK